MICPALLFRPWLMACALGFSVLAGGCARFHPAPPPGAPPDSRFATIDGVKLRYRDVGSGPPVVLVHGFASSLDVWRLLIPKLATRHRVIALDLKGFGYSGRPPGSYSPVAQARLLRGLLDRLGVRGEAAIVGHSWGAGVALAFAIENPARVARIALLSAYVYDEQVPPFYQWAQLSGLGEVLFSLYYRAGLEDRVALAFYDQSHVTQERIEWVEEESRRPGTVAAALAAVRGQRYAKLARHYPTIQAPVLLLWGQDDIVTPIRFGRKLAGELPAAELIEVPRCGHMPMFEARHRVTRALGSFLAGGRG